MKTKQTMYVWDFPKSWGKSLKARHKVVRYQYTETSTNRKKKLENNEYFTYFIYYMTLTCLQPVVPGNKKRPNLDLLKNRNILKIIPDM
jgi:hypothetical protein